MRAGGCEGQRTLAFPLACRRLLLKVLGCTLGGEAKITAGTSPHREADEVTSGRSEQAMRSDAEVERKSASESNNERERESDIYA